MKRNQTKVSRAERQLNHAQKAFEHENPEVLSVRFRAAKPLVPRNPEQSRYFNALKNFECVAGIGPAGTGKTYIAARYAIDCLLAGEIHRIVLVRPNVPLGNDIGSLPGTLLEKMMPWISPYIDAFDERIDRIQLEKFLAKGVIEVLPVQFLRGRSIKDAFILADEVQNLTVPEFECLLTRPAAGSKIFISGDIKQCDLGKDRCSGLNMVIDIYEQCDRAPFTIVALESNVRSGLSAFFSDQISDWKSVNNYVD